VVVLVILLGAFFFLLYQKQTTIKPVGKIFLTLYDERNPENGLRSIYSYDFDKEQLTLYYTNNYVTLLNRFSSQGDQEVFTLIEPGEEEDNLYLKKGKNISKLTHSTNIINHLAPSWSPDGNFIAYMGQLKESGDIGLTSLAATHVFLTDLDGNERIISPGGYPYFSPDGQSILLMKPDGVYIFGNLTGTPNGLQIGPPGTITTIYEKTYLSHDKSLFAWSFPGQGKIFIYEIKSWKPFSWALRNTIDAYADWPVFSPDNRYLAFLEVDETLTENEKLSVYDFETKRKKSFLKLENYDERPIIISEWIQ